MAQAQADAQASTCCRWFECCSLELTHLTRTPHSRACQAKKSKNSNHRCHSIGDCTLMVVSCCMLVANQARRQRWFGAMPQLRTSGNHSAELCERHLVCPSHTHTHPMLRTALVGIDPGCWLHVRM